MKKEIIDTWISKMKILPNKEPGLAHGLCVMVCCFVVIIPYGTLALLEVEVPNNLFIIAVISALFTSMVLFSKWKTLAMKLRDEEK